jgi:hypothetical protein
VAYMEGSCARRSFFSALAPRLREDDGGPGVRLKKAKPKRKPKKFETAAAYVLAAISFYFIKENINKIEKQQ